MKKQAKQVKNKNKASDKTKFKFPAKIDSIIAPIIIILTGLVVYWGYLRNGFVYDDFVLVIGNDLVSDLSLGNIARMFSSAYFSAYNPLTLLLYSIIYKIFAYNPLPYHAVSMVLHLGVSVSVFYLMGRFGFNKISSFIGAMIFLVHPVHIEAVAWIASFKDLLYALFFVLSWIYYIDYKQKEDKQKLYISLGFFLLSCLSKGTAVVLPVVLILTDYYFERKITKESIREKLPYLLLALVFGIIAILSQARPTGINPSAGGSIMYKILLLIDGLWLYFGKLFIAGPLSVYYPFPDMKLAGLDVYLSDLGIFTISGILIYYRKKSRAENFSALMILFTLLPIMQIIPFGNSFIADRFLYIPSIALIFLLVYHLSKQSKDKNYSSAGFIILVLIFGIVFLYFSNSTMKRSEVWKNNITLFEDVLEQYPESSLAYYNIGSEYNKSYAYKKALPYFKNAIKYNPKYTEAYNNMGVAYTELRQYDSAIYNFNRAIELEPKDHLAYNNLGVVYKNQKKYDQAIELFNKSIELNKKFADAYNNIGLVYSETGKKEEAVKMFEQALKINPKFSKAYTSISSQLYDESNPETSISQLKKAIEANPNDPEPYNYLGRLYFQIGDYNSAKANIAKALELNPVYAEAASAMGDIYLAGKNFEGAIKLYKNALRINPNMPETYMNLGVAYSNGGNYTAASKYFGKALEENLNTPQLYYNMANNLSYLNNWSEAEKMYLKAISLNNHYADAYLNLGGLYGRQNKFAEALDAFKRTLEINPQSTQACMNMALLYKKSGDESKMIEYYQKAARLGDKSVQDWLKSKGYNW